MPQDTALTWQQTAGIDDSHLVTIDNGLGQPVKINQHCQVALESLMQAANNDKVPLVIISGFRSFDAQLGIWNEKWLGHRPVYSRHGRLLDVTKMSDIEKYKAICLWSAMPGFSRHHWGTDIDVFFAPAVNAGYQVQLQPSEFTEHGAAAPLARWLNEQLHDFGFFRPYLNYQGGVSEEPWHLSHRAIAAPIMHTFDFDAILAHIEQSNIQGRAFVLTRLYQYKTQFFDNICDQP